MAAGSESQASTLKVKYKSATEDDFAATHGRDVSRDGIFVKTKKPLRLGALLRFEFQLDGGLPVLAGIGRVVWSRSKETATLVQGMGIAFVDLEPASRTLVERIVRARGGADSRFEDSAEADRIRPSTTNVPSVTTPRPAAAPVAPMPAAPPPAAAAPTPPRVSALQAPPSPVAPAPRIAPLPAPPPAAARAPTAPRVSTPEAPPAPVAPAPRIPPMPAPPPAVAAPAAPRIPPMPAPPPAAAAPAPPRIPPMPAPPPPAAIPAAPRIPRFPQATAAGRAEPADDLFSDSGLFDTGIDDRPSAPRTSFFPEAPAAKSVAAMESEALQSSDFLATALSEGGAADDTATEARAEAEFVRRATTAPPQHYGESRSGLFSDVPTTMATPSQLRAEPELAVDLGLRASLAAPVTPPPSDRMSLSGSASFADMDDDADSEETSASGPRAMAARRAGAQEYGEEDLSGGNQTLPVPPPSPNALLAVMTDAPPGTPIEPTATSSTTSASGAPGGHSVAKPVVIGLLALACAGFLVWRGLHEPAAAPENAAHVQVSTVPGATPPPATPATGPIRIEVTSTPRGAEVRRDGKAVGTTPTHIDAERGTKVVLVIASPGHAAATKELGPEFDGQPLHFNLVPLPYVLVVETQPPGGDLTALGKTAISPAPLELGHVSGSFTVTAGKDGYSRTTRPVRLVEFTEQDGVMRASIKLALSPLPPPPKPPKGAKRAPRAKPAATAPAAARAPVAPAPTPPPAPSPALPASPTLPNPYAPQ